MNRSWSGLNVNLSNLAKEIIQYFESKEFDNVTALKTGRGYQVIAGDSKQYKMKEDVSATIEGEANDFKVTLTPCKEERVPPLPLILTSMFGGGYFLLKNFRSEEAMQKLERDFRERIGSMVERSRETNLEEKTSGC